MESIVEYFTFLEVVDFLKYDSTTLEAVVEVLGSFTEVKVEKHSYK